MKILRYHFFFKSILNLKNNVCKENILCPMIVIRPIFTIVSKALFYA